MNITHVKTNDIQVNKAYYTAISDLIANIRPFKDGLLNKEEPVMIAGYGYTTPWTRDAAINTMNAGALLFPEVARNTLYSVLKKVDNQLFIDGEYWDAIIWAWGAWEYYKITNDKDFLVKAFEATVNSLKYFEDTEFDYEKNLFRGIACYGDGIAAYPDVYATHGYSGIISFATECKDLCVDRGVGIPMFALSTNCLYYQAYVLVDLMGKELGIASDHKQKAQAMKDSINRWFWMEDSGRYRYLVDPFGNCDHMEGIGHAFVLLFGIADEEKTQKVLKNQHITPCGISCVWPTFERYQVLDKNSYGRHSGTIWPHIQAFWADAAIRNGRTDLFEGEFNRLTQWSVRDGHFAEIYHPDTGLIYGGIQEDNRQGIREWESCKKQTWSATGYLHMLFSNILGIQFDEKGIRFIPYLPNGISSIEITNLCVRGKNYNICLNGCGRTIEHFTINGKECSNYFIEY